MTMEVIIIKYVSVGGYSFGLLEDNMYITFHSVRGENQSGVTPECAGYRKNALKSGSYPSQKHENYSFDLLNFPHVF